MRTQHVLLLACALSLLAACNPKIEALCTTDQDCVAGSRCSIPQGESSGLCIAGFCRQASDCEAGFGCDIAPGQTDGLCKKGLCTTKDDCLGGYGCRIEQGRTSGTCEQDWCTSNADCPQGTGCAKETEAAAGGFCKKDFCTANADCAPGFGCQRREGKPGGFCKPGFCTSKADCDASKHEGCQRDSKDATGGVCKPGFCEDNADCTSPDKCQPREGGLFGGFCAANFCKNSDDCDKAHGYRCKPQGGSTSGGFCTQGYCESKGDCAEEGYGCQKDSTSAQGGVCTAKFCESNSDCSGEDRCKLLGGDKPGGFCTFRYCTKDSECAQGFSCYASSGGSDKLCTANTQIPCTKPCGPGFVCVIDDSRNQLCQLQGGQPTSITVTEPAANRQFRNQPITITCKAEAPQVSEVSAEVIVPGVTQPVVVPLVSGGGSLYTGTFSPASSPEGDHQVVCKMKYGPLGFEQTPSSAPVPFLVDKTRPTITLLTPMTGWYQRSGTLQVKAKVADPGQKATGIVPASVKLVVSGKEFLGSGDTSGDYTFDVDLTKVGAAKQQKAEPFSVVAEDRVGNTQSVPGNINIDTVAPDITPDQDDTWHGKSASFTLRATVASEGAPVQGEVVLTQAASSLRVVGTLSNGKYEFPLNPLQLQADGNEGKVTVNITAKDEAGNSATAPATLNIDAKVPTLTITPVTAWQPRGQPVNVTVQVNDAGSGINPASVKVQTGNQVACQSQNATVYVCPVETQSVVAGTSVSNFAYRVFAADTTGNATEAVDTLKIDDKPPTVAMEDDSTWYGLSQQVKVRATITDDGSGLSPSAPPQLVANMPGGTLSTNPPAITGTDKGNGVWEFAFVPNTFVKAGITEPAFKLQVTAKDAVGLTNSDERTRSFDDTPPAVSLTLSGATPVVRNKTIDVVATVTDTGKDAQSTDKDGSGANPTTVKLTYKANDGTNKSVTMTAPSSGNDFKYTLQASDVQFNQFAGSVDITAEATDRVGNRAAPMSLQVPITRLAWTYNTGVNARVLGTVAVAGSGNNKRLFFAVNADDSIRDNVFALTATGTKAWSYKLAGTPTTPIAVGQNQVFLAYSNLLTQGSLVALPKFPANTSSVSADWSCQDIGSTTGALAVATWNWSGTNRETVISATDQFQIDAAYQNGSDCRDRTISTGMVDPSASFVSVSGTKVWIGLPEGQIATTEFINGNLQGLIYSSAVGTAAVAGTALTSAGTAFAALRGSLVEWNGSQTNGYQYKGQDGSNTFTSIGSPILADADTAFFGTSEGKLYKYSKPSTSPSTGFPVPLSGAAADIQMRGTPALDASGNVYIITRDGSLRSFGTNGQPGWTFALGAAVTTTMSPAIDCSGMLYVGTSNGQVHAIVTDSTGLANSSWPRFQHDNGNTGNLGTVIYNSSGCQEVP